MSIQYPQIPRYRQIATVDGKDEDERLGLVDTPFSTTPRWYAGARCGKSSHASSEKFHCHSGIPNEYFEKVFC